MPTPHANLTPTPAQVAEAAANIRGRTVDDIVHSAAAGLAETDPVSLAALIVALAQRFDAKAARREAKAA
jgi:hypothetical protein